MLLVTNKIMLNIAGESREMGWNIEIIRVKENSFYNLGSSGSEGMFEIVRQGIRTKNMLPKD